MRLSWHEEPSEVQLASIARKIDSDGFCQIDGFVDDTDIEKLAQLAERAVDDAGGEYIGFTGPDNFRETVWDRISHSPTFKNLCDGLYRHATGDEPPKQGLYQIFRCLKGQSYGQHSLYFHYDSYVVTFVIPIVIPDEGLPGNLVVYPAGRPIRKFYWRNVIDKLVVGSRPAQALLRHTYRTRLFKARSIKMVPGSAVIFWGYRCLHTNEACDPNALRATALAHFGNPHKG